MSTVERAARAIEARIEDWTVVGDGGRRCPCHHKEVTDA